MNPPQPVSLPRAARTQGTSQPEWLADAMSGADVVVFGSGLTDLRLVREALAARPELSVREAQMPMGSLEQRERFHALRACTGWPTLPQVFVRGAFVGGQTELLRHPILGAREGAAFVPASPKWVMALGYAGLLPFLAGLVMLSAPGVAVSQTFAATWLLGYGAVIAAFLGAAHWGIALTGTHSPSPDRLAAWAVIPSLLAWMTLLLEPAWGLAGQFLLFALILAVDLRVGAQSGWPRYYRRLRISLSVAVIVALGAGWMLFQSAG